MADMLVYVGFNSRVAALNRDTGSLAWSWFAPSGSGYVALLLDGDRLIASVQGYTYCLDPWTGRVLWQNKLEGFGVGVPTIASAFGSSLPGSLLAAADQDRTDTSSST